jgi:predicted HicB family RNase H-like nuclease
MMKYKNYTAVVEVDEDTGMLHGRVVGLRDGINFQGETVAEARKSFEESVDDYLEFCASRGEAPETPFSGQFLVRIKPSLHHVLVAEAERRRESLNSLIARTLADAFAPPPDEPRPRGVKTRAASPKPAPSTKPRPV